MDLEQPKDINKLKLKDLARDFAEAFTDLEKRFFKTLIDLTVRPEVVINTYTSGGQKEYFSLFRYFLISIFVGYLFFQFFFDPGQASGDFYDFMYDSMTRNTISKDTNEYLIHINKSKFNIFFTQMTELMSYFFKLVSCISIPVLFVGLIVCSRKSKYNIVSLFVASVFFSSHLSFLSSFLMLLAASLSFNFMMASSYFTYGSIFMYSWWVIWRMFKDDLQWPKLSTFSSALLVTLLTGISYVVYGSALSVYVHSKTPNYYYKEYIDPMTVTPEKSEETQPESI